MVSQITKIHVKMYVMLSYELEKVEWRMERQAKTKAEYDFQALDSEMTESVYYKMKGMRVWYRIG